ncbi:phospholipase D-like domain-containing protein [Tenggerimyces flavus]|uniref:Phospholipase D-like domain-containing protein n=1 Tax=Tenggerimyces flavus TaxID=1708749 RepID=A0ABV7YGA8_9ACTN|nr:phospholipase D-like domain-containing protein [Tenggerimyces flavus]MBM7788052.1 phosphatidylserine/phosphatidylglycerophosphate/cardiolipin synthase-like enzyme [Tenggerimyces flavus]
MQRAWKRAVLGTTVAIAALMAPMVATSSAAPAATTAVAYTPKAGPIGQHPTATGAQSSPIRRAILDNIANTPRSQTIRVVTWNLDDQGITAALIRAHQRGVHVQVLVWDRNCSSATAALRRAVGAAGDASFFKCIKHSARGPEGKGQLHQKSFTFSRTGTANHVSVVTSYNPTDHANKNQYNVAFQFVSNQTMHDDLKALFQQQQADRPRPARCQTAAPNDGRLFQHFFTNFGVMAYPLDCIAEDPLLTRLRTIPNPGQSVIRVATSGFTNERARRIAEELVRLRRAGASVKVMHTAGAGPVVRGILDRGGVSRLDTQTCGGAPANDVSFNHSKMLLVSLVSGGTRGYRSWLGSDNMADSSIHSDELMVQVTQPAHYQALTEFFEFTWKREAAQC